MKEQQPSLKYLLQPYLFITFAGLLAFAPVSFMLRALKNDIIALEYPINHFMSQCIHNGELPYWFNTWGMGFPLQSNLTWGIFSTPQMLFSSIFNYNIYVLHIEFMLFVLLAGWSMFHLLSKYFVKDKNIAQLLAIGYMLSGFVVGSTQWLLYITAAAFTPIVISSLLSLLYTPSLKNGLKFAIFYTMMFTSVYAAFNIIATYSIGVFLLLWFLFPGNEKKNKVKAFRFLVLSGSITALLCLPSLYYTAELLNYIDRGDAITADAAFFNSNYLHPYAVKSMLLPFSSVKMNYANTEGTMLNTYAGLFVLIILPAAIIQSFKEKNRTALLLFFSAIIFLLISFGAITPLRSILNILPGFSYFRNPAIFRFFFLLFAFLFLGIVLRDKSFGGPVENKNIFSFNAIKKPITVLLGLCIIAFVLNIKSLDFQSFGSLQTFIQNISTEQAIFISAVVQIIILAILLLAAKKRRFIFLKFLLIADLVINTLLCTPFFSVSSYSIQEVNNILASTPKFPIQSKTLNDVPAIFVDAKMNKWNNVNIFSKEVSCNESYLGPLILKNTYLIPADSLHEINNNKNKLKLLSAADTTTSIELNLQKPTHISAAVNASDSTTLTLMQNYYPGWAAFYNNEKINIIKSDKPGMAIKIPKGKGIVDFRYERKTVWIAALLLHLITIGFLVGQLIAFIKRIFFRSSSPSKQYQ